MDLIVAAGGQNANTDPKLLTPRLYKNDGHGNVEKMSNALPLIFLNASCLKPFDYDKDGDIDVFVGASVLPLLYGMSPQSFLLVNDGTGAFTNAVDWLGSSRFDNPTHVRPGLVKDAVWTDVNVDGLVDLILVGEWMPITVLIQNKNRQLNIPDTSDPPIPGITSPMYSGNSLTHLFRESSDPGIPGMV